jgi:hypothetical protein
LKHAPASRSYGESIAYAERGCTTAPHHLSSDPAKHSDAERQPTCSASYSRTQGEPLLLPPFETAHPLRGERLGTRDAIQQAGDTQGKVNMGRSYRAERARIAVSINPSRTDRTSAAFRGPAGRPFSHSHQYAVSYEHLGVTPSPRLGLCLSPLVNTSSQGL